MSMKSLTHPAPSRARRIEAPYYIPRDSGFAAIPFLSGPSALSRAAGKINHVTHGPEPPQLSGSLVLRIRTTDNADDAALVQEARTRGLGIGIRGDSTYSFFYAVWVRVDLPAQDPKKEAKILAAAANLNAFAAEVFHQKEEGMPLPPGQRLREPPRIELVCVFDRQPLVEPPAA